MKTSTQTGFPVLARHLVRLSLPLFVSVLAPFAAAADAPAGASEPKTHTLFMGVDFSIEYHGALYRVQDVVGSAFVIQVDGKEVRVPMDSGLGKFKVQPALKLTETSAAVANLKSERSYTIANDPMAQLARSQARSQLDFSESQVAYHQANAGFHSMDATAAVIRATPAGPGSPDPATTAAQNSVNAYQTGQASAQRFASSPGSNYSNGSNVMTGEGAYDAMDVAFEISAERPLNRPYIVLIVQYHPADAKPGQVGSWVYARALNPLGRGEPAKVHVDQGGFPPGFEVQDVQVHVYNQGEEVATNVAPKRVPLTREEAFQYLVVEYVGAHKGATLPPTPALGRLPADLPARLAKNEFQQTYYVRVNKEGKAFAAFSDESCSKQVEDAYLESVVRSIRFKPALEKGRPVEGIAPLRLNQLPL